MGVYPDRSVAVDPTLNQPQQAEKVPAVRQAPKAVDGRKLERRK